MIGFVEIFSRQFLNEEPYLVSDADVHSTAKVLMSAVKFLLALTK